jgi:hypothetical protein
MPIISLSNAIYLTQVLVGVAIILQTIELLKIKSNYTKSGVWGIKNLENQFAWMPKLLRKLLFFFFEDNIFISILIIRFVIAFLMLIHFNLLSISILLFINLIISIRWSGSFNGGSDYMTQTILVALLITTLSEKNQVIELGVYYIVFNLILSYLRAGISKAINVNWWNGKAMIGFLSNSILKDNRLILLIINNLVLSIVLSISVILWELFFLLSIANFTFASLFIATGIIFHLINTFLFGLNRFFWVWISAYPSLLYFACNIINFTIF